MLWVPTVGYSETGTKYKGYPVNITILLVVLLSTSYPSCHHVLFSPKINEATAVPTTDKLVVMEGTRMFPRDSPIFIRGCCVCSFDWFGSWCMSWACPHRNIHSIFDPLVENVVFGDNRWGCQYKALTLVFFSWDTVTHQLCRRENLVPMLICVDWTYVCIMSQSEVGMNSSLIDHELNNTQKKHKQFWQDNFYLVLIHWSCHWSSGFLKFVLSDWVRKALLHAFFTVHKLYIYWISRAFQDLVSNTFLWPQETNILLKAIKMWRSVSPNGRKSNSHTRIILPQMEGIQMDQNIVHVKNHFLNSSWDLMSFDASSVQCNSNWKKTCHLHHFWFDWTHYENWYWFLFWSPQVFFVVH